MRFVSRLFVGMLGLSGLLCLADHSSAQVEDNGLYDNTAQLEIYPPGYSPRLPLSSIQTITTSDGFDNFDAGVNFAEQHMSADPNNPRRFVFGANVSGSPGSAWRHSEDGGITWALQNPPGTNSGDPYSAYDSLGNVYIQFLSGSNNPVWRSTNNGVSWFGGIRSATGSDRNTLAVDQTGGPYSGYLYAGAWSPNATFARSTNNGASFTVTLSAPNTTPGNMIAVGANVLGGQNVQGGCVYFVTITGSNPAPSVYNFYRSTDGGATLTLMSSIDSVGYVGTLNTVQRLTINNARTRPYPMIAADNSFGPYRGRLYLVYATNFPAGNGNKPDIVIQYSTDQGATWSARQKVNDNPNPELTNEWFPAIWCDKNTGRLYVKWYDMRNDPTNQRAWVYGTYSDDGGVRFAPNQKLSNTDFPYPGLPCAPNTNCYRGDYDAIVSAGNVAMAVWTDFRSNTYQNMLSYFPDFALLARAARDTLKFTDSTTTVITVPAVKLYTHSVKFSATVSPAAPFVLSWVGRDSLNAYPDSVVLKIKTNSVPEGNYTVTVTGQGPEGTPVHRRTIPIRVQQIPNAITVLAPNGREIWVQTQNKQIRWRKSGDVTNVNIEYSTNNGGDWTTVGASVPATQGSINWTVPATPSTRALVRIAWLDSLSVVRDQSDTTFTISAPTPLIATAPESLRAVVQLGNTGFDTLRISNSGTLALNWSTMGTTWANALQPSGSVPADSTRRAPIRFTTTGLLGGTYFGNLTITSNDAFRPTATVPIRLTAVGIPFANTSRDSVNFAGVLVGSVDSAKVTVRNTGTDTLRGVTLIRPIGRLTTTTPNIKIAPNDSTRINLRFAPLDTITYTATLHIISNDPSTERDTLFVYLRGRGTPTTSVRLAAEPGIPNHYMLKQNYPNPFNPSTNIRFGIPSNGSGAEHTTLIVFDALGREVATLVNDQLAAGTYSATFETNGLSSGIYFYRLTSGKFIETKKGQLLK